MENKDEECLKKEVISALKSVVSNPKRITKILKAQSEKLDWSGIVFPVELDKISKFEIAENVLAFGGAATRFGYEISFEAHASLRLTRRFDFHPLRISKEENRKHVINLWLTANDGKKLYYLINNMSRLLSSRASKHKEARLYFLRCLNHFSSEENLTVHKSIGHEMRQSGSRCQIRIA